MTYGGRSGVAEGIEDDDDGGGDDVGGRKVLVLVITNVLYGRLDLLELV